MTWCQFTLSRLLAMVAVCGGAVLGYQRFGLPDVTPYRTGRNLDLAILGRGFFQVMAPATGEFRYTRDGHLSMDANGDLLIGRPINQLVLQPPITIPPDWTEVAISRDGAVAVQQAGSPQLTVFGQIQLAKFMNEEGLREEEPGVFAETDSSGPVHLTNPGIDGGGIILQGWLNGRPAWSRLMADNGVQSYLLGAITLVLVWQGLELRRQRRTLAALLDPHRTDKRG